jgi:hypothetical protein
LEPGIRKDAMVESQYGELHEEGRPGVDFSEDKFALEGFVNTTKGRVRDIIPKESSVNRLAT